MAAKEDQTLATNSNPELSIDKDVCIVYSNEASNLLLNEWDVEIGEKLPSSIVDLVQRVASQNSPEKMEVKVGNNVYLVVFSPLPEQECVNIFGFDISDQEKLEIRDISILHKLSTQFIEGSDSQSIFQEIVDAAIAITNADKGNIQTFDPSTGKLTITAQRGFTPLFLEFFKSVDARGTAACGAAMKQMKRVVVEDINLTPIFSGSNALHVLLNEGVRAVQSTPLISRSGQFLGIISTHFSSVHTPTERELKLIDILARQAADMIERKQAEEALKKAKETLEEKVKERTEELEKAYNLLKKSENNLAEAQEMAHIGSWEHDLRTNEVHWSDELYRIFGLKPQEGMNYKKFLNYVHPDDRDYVYNSTNDAFNGNVCAINYRIVRPDGEERIIHPEKEVIFDEKNNPIRIKGILQDITEHEKTEEKIKILANVVESTLDAIGTLSLEGIVTSWNKGAEQIYGYLSDEIIGKHISIPDPSQLKNETQEYIELIKQTGMSYRYITSRMRKDREIINVSITISPVIDSHGKLIAISFISRNITEQKRAEEIIRESEEKYRNIVEIANEGIALISNEGVITYVNRKMADMLGCSVEEIVDRTIWDFVEEKQKSAVTTIFERRRKCKIDSFEIELIRKDGTPLRVLINAKAIFDRDDKFIGSLNLHTDITERKKAEEKLRESEEKYRNIVETANELILITDNENVITYVNKRIVDMLGYTPEKLIGRPIWDFISEECKPIVKENLEKRRQDVNGSYELKLIHKDGSYLWTFLNAKPLFDKEGKYVGVMSMLTDITKRKKAEEALNNIETARKKEIHHRIKNNLQVISSLLELQAEKFNNRRCVPDSEVLEAFRESRDRVISMALIHEELYKGEGFEALNFSPYIQKLADTLFQTYRLGNTDISLNIDMEENLSFDMDTAVPLGMIVNELVSNSLKHAFIGRDKGEVRIKLHRDESTEFESKSSESTSKSTGFILTISDNGVGIPENLDIKNLDSLGMQLVTSLVDQLDGELELKRDNGTEFTIRFTVTERGNQESAIVLH